MYSAPCVNTDSHKHMSAAFDTVDHDLLLDILHKRFGIADTALQWYQSYLRP